MAEVQQNSAPQANNRGNNQRGGNNRGPRRDQAPGEPKQFEELVINIDRVSRVVKGGRRFRFKALVVVGDRKARVGVGVAKGADVQVAVQKATISSGLSNREKNIRKLEKKLEQIRELKAKLADGVQLELNQLDKIKTEKDLEQELQAIIANPEK